MAQEGVSGKVIAVCASERKGTAKVERPEVVVAAGLGVEDDAHAGPGPRQVSLLATESVDTLRARGVDVGPGGFGENVLTIGIDLVSLPIGALLRVGAALIEVTAIGKECHAPCAIYRQAGTCVMPTDGIFCRVVAGGAIRPGDAIVTTGGMDKIAAVLVASDSRSKGANEDLAGPAAEEALALLGIGVAEIAVVPDDANVIAARIEEWCERGDLSLVLTSGGTGLGPRDVTPEATLRVVERLAPGIAELLRAEGRRKTPHAALSRAVAGVRGRTLVVNLPGSPRAVKESIGFLAALLPHAIETVSGKAVECAAP
ncbi:MAG: molybdopterin-binding protein [Deltaproteobacteria bacterium]|nr:molybdopterin-binding protein [Deltaproteobacteria bacterium]